MSLGITQAGVTDRQVQGGHEMMATKETLGVRFLKHGLCAVTVASLLAVSVVLVGQVFSRSVADITMHTQYVKTLTFE